MTNGDVLETFLPYINTKMSSINSSVVSCCLPRSPRKASDQIDTLSLAAVASVLDEAQNAEASELHWNTRAVH